MRDVMVDVAVGCLSEFFMRKNSGGRLESTQECVEVGTEVKFSQWKGGLDAIWTAVETFRFALSFGTEECHQSY